MREIFIEYDMDRDVLTKYITALYIHYRKMYGISGKCSENIRIWRFYLLEIAWQKPQTNIVIVMEWFHNWKLQINFWGPWWCLEQW